MRLSDDFDVLCVVIIAYVAGILSGVLGYTVGKSVTQKEAVRVGVAEYSSDNNGDSVFRWLEKRRTSPLECSCRKYE
jgi:membrane protein DedA with SNARE-associated domain